MLNACHCFYDVELQRTITPDERHFQYREVSDSKPGKIKKTFTIMASTSRASRKTVEDTEIFQVLEKSTDSDVTVFSSEEDEGGNESDSDEDGQF